MEAGPNSVILEAPSSRSSIRSDGESARCYLDEVQSAAGGHVSREPRRKRDVA